jgi:hypothetical protein
MSDGITFTPSFMKIGHMFQKQKCGPHTYTHTHTHTECPCDGGNQTVDHILYDCIKLQREREKLIHNLYTTYQTTARGQRKKVLVKKHIKHFINSIDFEKL